MKMLDNLFSIFDPMTSTKASFNWLSSINCLIILPLIIWVSYNRLTIVLKMMMNYIFNEFKGLIKSAPQILTLVVSLFLMIMISNILSLLPYVFTPFSHMSFTMTTALPLWVALMMYSLLFNTSNMLAHLIPVGTPFTLIPFMAMIETISNIIRPLTLSIRLAANMVAGHLLITLLTTINPFMCMVLSPITLSTQMMLITLEVAVSILQAYVFSILITMYAKESVN